uniref:BZIP domain-containing protein n=1 Tax=Tetranychus urticae TaxID=32264 RepID=T1JS40_TETUR
MNTFPSFIRVSAPTPPESPLNFADGPLDLTSSYSSCKTPEQLKDEAYRLKRDKNNIAAKKSRDARRAREAATAVKAERLKHLVLILKTENEMLRRKVEHLKESIKERQTENEMLRRKVEHLKESIKERQV